MSTPTPPPQDPDATWSDRGARVGPGASREAPDGALGHYSLLERIGEGGMGVVHRARDTHLDRDVAIKLLPPGAVISHDARERFRTEARALSRLNHPNIATIHDFDSDGDVDFLVMEFVDGPSLAELVREGPLQESRVIECGLQLAEGLAAAYAKGVLHRDLKPSNLKLTAEGRLKILDFGLAKLLQTSAGDGESEAVTRTAGLLGTIPYMAPEQLRNAALDGRTDVYGAGAVIYELATGRRLHPGCAGATLIDAILHAEPSTPRAVRAELTPDLERILLKACQKDPRDRYQSAEDLASDLRRLRAGQGVTAPHRPGPKRRRTAWSIVAGAALVGSTIGLWIARDRIAWRAGSAERVSSLAVLPLANLSGDAGKEFFADGVTEALITDLGKVGALRVIARPSVMRFKGSTLSLPDIARQLRVEAFVVGSVTPIADRVRVTVQLVDARDERQVWSERYERDVRDVLQLQGEIARAVAERVRAALTPGESAVVASSRRLDPAAHEAYLKARFHLARFTADDVQQAKSLLLSAISRDPAFAEAYAALGYAYFLLGQPLGAMPFQDAIPPARSAVLKAIEIDDSLAEAYTTLGYIQQLHDYDWAGAEASHRRALALNPNYAYGHSGYAFLLAWTGRFDEALAAADRAVLLDPVSLIVRAHRAEILYNARRFDEAIAECRRTIEMDASFERSYQVLRWSYERQGRYREALDALDHFTAYDAAGRDALRRAFESGGPHGYWRWQMDWRAPGSPGFIGYELAAGYAAQAGETARSLDWLEKAADLHDGGVAAIFVDSIYDPVRNEPRFRALLRRLRFPG